VENFRHQFRAVLRDDTERVAGFVGEPGVSEVELDMANLLGRAGCVEKP
jgi:hypothetical protein